MTRLAIIPVRSGSKRLPKKNYHPFNFRNLLQVALEKCNAADCFDKIVITSDDDFFRQFANKENIEFLKRTDSLSNDDATTDQVIDFVFEKFPTSESLIWVNSVSPLQKVEDILNCSLKLNEVRTDCVMAVNSLYQHCVVEDSPINFDPKKPFEKTQDLVPVKRYVYSCMGWKRETYVGSRESGFKGLFPGRLEYVEVSTEAGMLVKYEDDFKLFAELEKALGMAPNVNIPTDGFV